MSFFQKDLPPPPPLLEFSRHFFQWCLLQVFNAKIIMILELVMGKVISTLTTTTSITRTLPQNCPKTASKLPQNCLKTFGFLLTPPLLAVVRHKKSASKLLNWSGPPPLGQKLVFEQHFFFEGLPKLKPAFESWEVEQ